MVVGYAVIGFAFFFIGRDINSPIVIAISYFFVFGLTINIYSSAVMYNRIRKSKDTFIRIDPTDERFQYESDTLSGSVPWNSFKSYVEYKGFILLCTDKRTYRVFASIPTEGMSDEIKNFIEERISAAGGKLIDRT